MHIHTKLKLGHVWELSMSRCDCVHHNYSQCMDYRISRVWKGDGGLPSLLVRHCPITTIPHMYDFNTLLLKLVLIINHEIGV